MTLRRRPLLAVATLLVATGLGSSAGLAAVSYDLSVGAGSLMNDNLHLDPAMGGEGQREPVEETIFAGVVSLGLNWSGPRDHLKGEYRGEYWEFTGDEEQAPLWLHALETDLAWRRWSPLFLEARESLARIPRSTDAGTESIVEQIDRNRLHVRTGLAWEFGTRGIAELAYLTELENFSGAEDLDRVRRQSGEGLARYRWSPLWGSETRVRYGRVDHVLVDDYNEFSAAATVDQRWSEHLTARYRLEWLREEDLGTDAEAAPQLEREGSRRDRLLKTVELRGDLGHGGSWSLAYADREDDLSDGDRMKTGRASAKVAVRPRLDINLVVKGWYEDRDFRGSGREEQSWGPILNLRWTVAPWAACDLGGSWTSTDVSEPGAAQVEDRSIRVAVGVVLLAYDRLTLEAGYSHWETSSTDVLRSYTNNILYVFATLHLRRLEKRRLPASYSSGLTGPPATIGAGRTGEWSGIADTRR